MLGKIVRKVVGSKNDRELKRMGKTVAQINALEEEFSAISDDALRAKTDEFKKRCQEGESLDQLLPEAFAAVREAGKRTLKMRHFDVQLIGGMTLHQGRIAEMRTGEGKTLVATLPAYLNALSGGSVHLVTVNDYLAARDADWMRPIYEFLGLSVGVVVPQQDPVSKKEAYQCDIIYGTNNEFGFDYLRDNMAFSKEDRFQRDRNFAIVDEVDSILIDEARTPLIISGQAEDSSELYKNINKLAPSLTREIPESEGEPGKPGDFVLDEKSRQIELTEQGHQKVEGLLVDAGLLEEGDSLYSAVNLGLLHHVHSALKAHNLFIKNVEYIVQGGEVILIDENTGRTMHGRRLSEGLHQAIEAKEGVRIQSESQTLASTTFQNYFRLYDKLAGMSGSADTEAFEFNQIYGLDVVVIPTNMPIQRQDLNDLVFLSEEDKYDAIVRDVQEIVKAGAPVLVGTASVETSERVSAYFTKAKIEHKVLNAKFHESEAEIIAQAGRPGVVTVATNMAGRGTDIVLGGNLEVELENLGEDASENEKQKVKDDWKARHAKVMEAGGLHIIGTERHESRRIDNQLRGRAGRQGDPGYSRFYLSLEDNLMRIFASDRVRSFMQAVGMEKGEAIEHRMVTNAIEKAQRKVEGRNFDIRKQLLEYDDVANEQRQIIYRQRDELLEAADVSETIANIRADVVDMLVNDYIPPQSLEEQWDVPGLEQFLASEFSMELPVQKWLDEDNRLDEEGLREKITKEVEVAYRKKEAEYGDELMRRAESFIFLQVLDQLWKEHLSTMDHLRQGIHLRGYAGKNPKQEYKREAFELFQELLINLKHDVIKMLSHLEIRQQDDIDRAEQQRREQEEALRKAQQFQHAQASAVAAEAPQTQGATQPEQSAEAAQPFVREQPKVGRNDPCPCGSGKKYKQCHGKL